MLINPFLDLFRLLEPQDDALRLAARKKLIWAYSWAVPGEEAIAALRELSPLVELGAGTGYWAWLLAQAGARVTAYDLAPEQPPHWHEVLPGGPERLDAHPRDTLLLCWPPLGEPMADQALARHRGELVASVGEPRGGRTADDAFHARLARDFTIVREIPIPSWPGFRDRLTVYRRRPA